MKALSLILSASLVLTLSQIAAAVPVTNLVKTGSATINSVNYNIYQLQVATTTTWTNQHLALDLTQGSIYEDSAAPFAPNPLYSTPNSGFFGYDSNLAYTTYFTMPTGYPNNASPTATAVIFGNPGPTSTHLFIDWNAPTSTTNTPGTYVVAQLTLSSNAIGTFSGVAWDLSNAGASAQTPNYSGTIAVPEPASMAILGLGMMGLLARKRRRA